MASGSSSLDNRNSEETISLDDLRGTDFVNQALPTIVACIERDDFDETTASMLYSMLRFLHGHMLDSVASVEKSKYSLGSIAEKVAENDATINLCAKLMNSAASPEVLKNFTPDQQKEIQEMKSFLTIAGANPALRGRKRKFEDPKDEEIAKLKSQIAAMNEELEYQKKVHEELMDRFEQMDTQFNIYRYENEQKLSECLLNSELIKQAYLRVLFDFNGA